MTQATQATNSKRKSRELRSVEGGASTTSEKPKRERKPRAGGGGNDFHSQLRALAKSHRAKISKYTTLETKLESKLAAVRAQREAAEGPLRDVEAILANHPELPGVAAEPSAAPVSPLDAVPSKPVDAAVDEVNQ